MKALYNYQKRNKIKSNELLIFLSLFFFTTIQVDIRVSNPLFFKYSSLFIYISVLLSMSEILLKRTLTKKQFVLLIIIGLFLIINSLPSGLHMLIYWFIILYGLRDKDIDKYFKFVFVLITIYTTSIFILSKFGIYENILSIQYLNGKARTRYSLGFSSWTILPFQFLSLVMYYVYLKKDRIHLSVYIIFLLIAYYLFKYTNTRSAFLYLFAFIILSNLCKFIHEIHWHKLYLLIGLPWIFAGISYLLIVLYQKGNIYIEKLNILLNQRFYYASRAVDMYKIRWFSNREVEWISDAQNYLIVDNSYLSILLKWGILGLIAILFVYSYLIFLAIKRQDKYLLLCVLMILFICLMWERLLVFPDTIFILLFGYFFTQKKHI